MCLNFLARVRSLREAASSHHWQRWFIHKLASRINSKLRSSVNCQTSPISVSDYLSADVRFCLVRNIPQPGFHRNVLFPELCGRARSLRFARRARIPDICHLHSIYWCHIRSKMLTNSNFSGIIFLKMLSLVNACSIIQRFHEPAKPMASKHSCRPVLATAVLQRAAVLYARPWNQINHTWLGLLGKLALVCSIF